MVYWNSGEVLSAVVGGLLIGLSSTLNLRQYGRVTGLSGYFNTVIKGDTSAELQRKYAFLAGLIADPVLFFYIFGTSINFTDTYSQVLFDSELIRLGVDTWGFIVGGLLVGVGSKMANGCTSGHGVCGVPRLSFRSITAVVFFLLFGVLVATFRSYNNFFYLGQAWDDGFVNGLYWFGLVVYALI